jgi:glucan biosynthesis protein
MEEAFDNLGAGFAKQVIAGDFESARAFLAPWLQGTITADGLKAMMTEAQGELPAPAQFDLDGNSCQLSDLEVDEYSPPTRPLPSEITEQNFRKWMCIQFQPDAAAETGYDACFDLWMALVDVDGSLKIGYLEPTGAD